MLISEIDLTTKEGQALMQAIKLRSIENDMPVQDCLNTIVQFANVKPLPAQKPFDNSAQLQDQIRHLESERNRLQEALNHK